MDFKTGAPNLFAIPNGMEHPDQNSKLWPTETRDSNGNALPDGNAETFGLAPRLDVHNAGYLEDPYPVYESLRACPLARAGAGTWAVARHADVAALLQDARLKNHLPTEYRRVSMGDGPAGEFVERIMLYRDGAAHARLRALVSSGLERGMIRLRRSIKGLVDSLLAPSMETSALEFVGDLAFPLPILIIGEIMGIPPGDRDEIRRHALNLGKAFVPVGSDSDRALADAAVVWLRTYIGDLLRERQRTPGSDLLSVLSSAGLTEHGLSQEDVIDNAVFLLFAGFETTMHMLSNGCAALLAKREEMDLLRRERSLIPSAVEEFLRFDAPIQSRLRFVSQPIEVGTRHIKAGRALLLLLGSANHDRHLFLEPSTLNLRRSPNPHLSFGGGAHYCLGAGLARLEGVAVFDGIMRNFSQFELAGEAVRNKESAFRGFRSIPVRVRAA